MSGHDLSDLERERVAPYVTDTTGPVFALTNLPEVVKGALFARYSRSPSRFAACCSTSSSPPASSRRAPGRPPSARRAPRPSTSACSRSTATTRWPSSAAPTWRWRGRSNLLTKVIQWGRLASYLEQSTRYIPYTDRPGGRYRYHRPRR